MTMQLDYRHCERVLCRSYRVTWKVEPFGVDGFTFVNHSLRASVITTEADHSGTTWRHASIAYADTMPEYDDLVTLHKATFPNAYAYQVFAPPDNHINIHPNALHLWGRVDGRNVLPNFGVFGTI